MRPERRPAEIRSDRPGLQAEAGDGIGDDAVDVTGLEILTAEEQRQAAARARDAHEDLSHPADRLYVHEVEAVAPLEGLPQRLLQLVHEPGALASDAYEPWYARVAF